MIAKHWLVFCILYGKRRIKSLFSQLNHFNDERGVYFERKATQQKVPILRLKNLHETPEVRWERENLVFGGPFHLKKSLHQNTTLMSQMSTGPGPWTFWVTISFRGIGGYKNTWFSNKKQLHYIKLMQWEIYSMQMCNCFEFGKVGPASWRTRISDRPPCDGLLCGYVKDKVYRPNALA